MVLAPTVVLSLMATPIVGGVALCGVPLAGAGVFVWLASHMVQRQVLTVDTRAMRVVTRRPGRLSRECHEVPLPDITRVLEVTTGSRGAYVEVGRKDLHPLALFGGLDLAHQAWLCAIIRASAALHQQGPAQAARLPASLGALLASGPDVAPGGVRPDAF